MMHTFDLQAHRGGRLVRPENTLAAFEYAIRLGVSTLELDMHITADNEVVISHNPVLSWYLARDGQGQWIRPGYEPVIYAMTLDEVRQYNVSQVNPGCGEYWSRYGQHQQASGYEQVPTLAEVFALVQRYEADAIRFNIETKCYPGHPEWSPEPDQFCQSVLAVVDQFGMHKRVMVQSFDWRTLAATRQLNEAITCVALTDSECRQTNDKGISPWQAGLNLTDYGGSIVLAAKAAGADILSPHYHDITREMMKEAAYLHMPVIPWTVNNRHDMTELIDLGVAGLISDDPALLRQILAERKLPLPPAYVLKNR